MTMTKRQKNLYNNLKKQIEKAFDTNKRQAKNGNSRYEASCKSFAKHLATKYHSQNFKNIRKIHIESFVQERVENELDGKTIRNDLSAIRKLHDLLPQTNHKLPKNSDLELPAIVKKEEIVDRSWTEEEYEKALHVAESMNRNDIVDALKLAKNFGTRINEATALNTKQLEQALKNNYLHLTNTKNGVPRDVPIENIDQRAALNEILENNGTGRIFIKHNTTHSQAKAKISDWIYNNRNKFQTGESSSTTLEEMLFEREKTSCTFHGLRHRYARDTFNKNIKEGMTEKQAKRDVSHKLGHGRDAVTNKYL